MFFCTSIRLDKMTRVHYFYVHYVHYGPTTAILSHQSTEILCRSNPTINTQSAHTFIVCEIQTRRRGALHNHKESLAGAVIKSVPGAAFLRWKTNETLWGWADSPPILQLHLSLPATYSEQERFPARPPSQGARWTSWVWFLSSVFSLPRQQEHWSIENTCKLRVMRLQAT